MTADETNRNTAEANEFIKKDDMKSLTTLLDKMGQDDIDRYDLVLTAVIYAKNSIAKYIISVANFSRDNLYDIMSIAIRKYNKEVVKYMSDIGLNMTRAFESCYRTVNIVNNVKFMKFLVSIGLPIRKFQRKIFERAVEYDKIEMIKYLVSVGANVRYNNDSLLMEAAKNDRIKIFNYLVSRGCDIHAQNDDAIKYASIYGNIRMVKYLLDLGLDRNKISGECLEQIVYSDDLDGIKYLVELNLPNVIYYIEDAIQSAANQDYVDIVKYLMTKVEITDTFVNKCFVKACHGESTKVAKYFIELGVDVTIENNIAIRSFAVTNDLDLIKCLISRGANHRINNDAPLVNATRYGFLDTIKYLVSIGSDIHAQNDMPICVASRCNGIDIVKYLVSLGADTHAYEDAPLRKAAKNGRIEIVEYLISVGANVHAKNNHALRRSIANYYWQTALVLAINGASYDAAFVDGLRYDAPRWLLDGFVYSGIDPEHDNDHALRRYVDNIRTYSNVKETMEMLEYLISLGLWYIPVDDPETDDEEYEEENEEENEEDEEEMNNKNGGIINPYRFLDYLNDKHIAKINDPMITAIIRSKVRRYDAYYDLSIVCL